MRKQSLSISGKRLWLVGASIALFAQQAAALSLDVDGRTVQVTNCFDEVCGGDSAFPGAAFAAFNDSATVGSLVANQNTTVSTSAMSGTVDVVLDTPQPDSNFASSLFDVAFTAGAAELYSFTGTAAASGPTDILAGLFDITTNTLIFSFTTAGPHNSAGALTSGDQYLLRVYSNLFGEGSAGWDFEFTVGSNVPEPSTATLLGLGLLGLAIRRGRRA